MNPATDNRFKAFTTEEQAVLETALKALASSGGGEQPIKGGELPPALIGAKPVKDEKGVTTMNTEKEIAGATPAVGAESKFGPTDRHNEPGSDDVGIGAKPVGDKGTFSPTLDKDEEEVKSLQARLDALKTLKAKREAKVKYEELYETYSAGRKAEEALKAEVLKQEAEIAHLKEEMGLTNAQSYAPQTSATPLGAAPAVPSASAATGLKDVSGGSIDAHAQGDVPKTSAPGQVSTMPPTSPQAIADPTALQEEEEAIKAMRSAITGLVSKYFGKSFPTGVVEFQKEFDDMLSQVAQPKGGTENLTNVASPGQPPAKVSALPGKSGSSEVFRTDTGKAFEQDDIFDRARKNPAGTLETEKDEPIATYDEATHLTTGGGYQPALLRSAPQSTFHGRRYEPEIHKSFATRQGYSTNPVEDKLTAKRTLPVLKHLASSNTVSKEELALLEKEGKIVDSLVQKVEPKKDTFLTKNLKRVYGQ